MWTQEKFNSLSFSSNSLHLHFTLHVKIITKRQSSHSKGQAHGFLPGGTDELKSSHGYFGLHEFKEQREERREKESVGAYATGLLTSCIDVSMSRRRWMAPHASPHMQGLQPLVYWYWRVYRQVVCMYNLYCSNTSVQYKGQFYERDGWRYVCRLRESQGGVQNYRPIVHALLCVCVCV